MAFVFRGVVVGEGGGIPPGIFQSFSDLFIFF